MPHWCDIWNVQAVPAEDTCNRAVRTDCPQSEWSERHISAVTEIDMGDSKSLLLTEAVRLAGLRVGTNT